MSDKLKEKSLTVVKTVDLKASIDRAFRHFTANIHVWWPLATHSISGKDARTVVFEAQTGGRIYEVDAEGREREWGRVLACEPPRRVLFSWVLEAPADATAVDVTFEALGPANCRFRLEHRGFELRSEGALWRDRYDQGWEGVATLYAGSLGRHTQ
jgi:uncharacterized protein YndB with AHSA1/START domain